MLNSVSSFFKKYLDKRYLVFYILLIDLFLITFLVIICLGSTLTADDYQFFAFTNTQNYFYLIGHYGSEISGRYSFAFTVVTFIKLFKLKALFILPVLSLLLLIGGAIFSVIGYLKIIKKHSSPLTRLAVVTTIFAVIGSLITAPSIFDTFVWFSATPVYILSFAILFIAIAITLHDITSNKQRIWLYIIVLLLTFIAAGYLEVIPIELVIFGIIGVIVSRRRKLTVSIYRVKLSIYGLIFFASGLIGGAILRFSSWTSLRLTSGRRYNLHQMINIILGHLQLVPQYIFSWRILFPLAIGIIAFICLGKVAASRNKIMLLILALVLITVPSLIIGALAASSGLIEATGMASNRLLYDGTSGIMLGCALLIYLLIGILCPYVKFKISYIVAPIILLSILLVGFGYSVSSLNKVAQAVYVKKSMFEYREAVIANDMGSHANTVRIVSASILLANSQIDDIGFGSPKVQVWEGYLRTYYHIPVTTKLAFSSVAPAGYCTLTSDSVTYGKQTCNEIVSSANSLTYTIYP